MEIRMDKSDFITFVYPALLLIVGVVYVICGKFSKPNFFIGYRNKLNRKNETLWKISNFVSGIMFSCFAFFHCCVCLALIAIKYIAGLYMSLTVLVIISQSLFLIELVVVIISTNTFIRWTKEKLKSSSPDESDY